MSSTFILYEKVDANDKALFQHFQEQYHYSSQQEIIITQWLTCQNIFATYQ